MKGPNRTSTDSPSFTIERTRTQPSSETSAQSPLIFSRAPALGVSNSTLEASLSSRFSLSFR
jgi:hypothetical protein